MTKKSNNNKKRIGVIIKNKKFIVISLIVILAGVVFVMISKSDQQSLDLIIGEETIVEEEFIRAMNGEIHDVTQHFYNQNQNAINEAFWLREHEGEIPYKMLADNTIEELSLIHANYQTAKEKGYLNSASYEDLLKRFEEENRLRAEKIQNGEPVYGLAEFSLDMFIIYEMDQISKLYIEDPSNEDMTILDEEVKAYYEEKKEPMFIKNDDIEMEYIQIYYGALDYEESEVAALKEDLQAIQRELSSDQTLESIIEDYPNVEQYYEHIDILSAEVSSWSRNIGDVLELSAELDDGEWTQVIDQNNSLYLIRVIERGNYDYEPLDTVRSVIDKMLREEKYEQIMKEKAEEIAINGDMDEIYAFTKEQLVD